MCTFDATTSNNNAAIVGFVHNEWAETSRDDRKRAVVEGELFRGLTDGSIVQTLSASWAPAVAT
jgi:hypothetical protein